MVKRIFFLFCLHSIIGIIFSLGSLAKPKKNQVSTTEWCLKNCTNSQQECYSLFPERMAECHQKCVLIQTEHSDIAKCIKKMDSKLKKISDHLDQDAAIRVMVSYGSGEEKEIEKKSIALSRWKKAITAINKMKKENHLKRISEEQAQPSPIVKRDMHIARPLWDDGEEDIINPRPITTPRSQRRKYLTMRSDDSLDSFNSDEGIFHNFS
ncbi:MAG: hypothetical protein WCG05_03930 [Alphaproteobacteria bacterium]